MPPRTLPPEVETARADHRAGRIEEARRGCEAALARDPGQPDALNLLSVLAAQAGDHARALDLVGQALARDPANPNFLSNRGATLHGLGRDAEAVAAFDAALAGDGSHVAAWTNRGHALARLGRYGEAAESYRRSLILRPDHAPTLYRLACANCAEGRTEEGVRHFRRAIELQPGFAEACNDLGTALKDLDRVEEAVAAYEHAIRIRPELAEAHLNLGTAQKALGRREEALASYARAISLRPDLVEARWSAAVSQLPVIQGVGEAPDDGLARFDAAIAELDAWLEGPRAADGHRAIAFQQPFHLAYQERDHRDRLARYGALCARLAGARQRREGPAPPVPGPRGGRALRLAIASSHFCNHSVWHALLEGWTRSLDASRFELHLFHLGTASDEHTAAARRRAASFTQGLGDARAWAEAIAGRRPDVLLYPEIGLHGLTTRLASMRLAPVQAASWGHPVTTGLPTIDHYLSAADFEPDDADAHYTERLVRLPHLGCLYPPNRIEPVPPDLAALGIQPGVPLLLSPGATFKYTPRQDALFARIARTLGRCQIVFFSGQVHEQARLLQARMRAAFVQEGADLDATTRWIPWQPRGAFYGLMQRADAFLDTIGFSGFNTAMQGIEAGIPIVTREGRFMRGRLASGILRRMGLGDLVAETDDDYVESAVRMSQDRAWREGVRARILAARGALFDDEAPIRAMEDFLQKAEARP